MSDIQSQTVAAPPARFEQPKRTTFLFWVVVIGLLAVSVQGAEVSLPMLIEGLPSMGNLLIRMFPPDLSRLPTMGLSLLQTFEMAFAGTAFGLVLSLPLAILATRKLSPHPVVYEGARSLIGVFRTVPDLMWALFFVVSVGLGPFAGVMAIAVDTVGFCGRFFAEAMEEVDEAPQEGLRALGAGRLGIIFCAVFPAAMPSFIATALFSLEKATRASVVLGLVGAGGIGNELNVAMELFKYNQAATVIIMILALVLTVERLSAAIRRRVL